MNHAVGLAGLLRDLQLQVPPPAVRSEVGSTARRTIESPDEVTEIYPLTYNCHTIQDHLRFALRYEPQQRHRFVGGEGPGMGKGVCV